MRDGVEKQKFMHQEAEKQSEKIAKRENILDLTLEKMDCFQFQEQDYKEKRKEYEALMAQEQMQNVTDKGQNYVRTRRAAHATALDHIHGKTTHDFHDAIN